MLLSVRSAADRPNRRRGSWPFHRATNRHQRTRIAVAIDQNAAAIPWSVARDLTSVLVVSGFRSSTNRYLDIPCLVRMRFDLGKANLNFKFGTSQQKLEFLCTIPIVTPPRNPFFAIFGPICFQTCHVSFLAIT